MATPAPTAVGVVVAEDGEARLRRLTFWTERHRTGRTVVVDVVAGVDEGLALLEGRALRAVAGDAVDVGGDQRRVVGAGDLGGQRRDDDRVVGLRAVAEVDQRRIDLEQRARKSSVQLGLGQGALDADQRTGGQLLTEGVADVAVDQVDRASDRP